MMKRIVLLAGVLLFALACSSEDSDGTGGSGAGGTTAQTGGRGGDTTAGTGGDGGEAVSSGGGGSGGTGGSGAAGGSPVVTVEGPLLVGATACGSQTDATLRWVDNSNNEDGFIIERSVAGGNAFAQVANVAADTTTYTDTTATGGTYEYRVVAYNAEASATSNTRTVALAVPAQTASLAIDPTTLAVTVTTQPSHFRLRVPDAATWAGVGNDMTIGLELVNSGMKRVVFNPKVVVTSVTDSGTVTGDGNFGADPFVYYGPEGLDIDAAATRELVITGLTAPAAPIAVDVRIENHASLFYVDNYCGSPVYALDSSGTGQGIGIDISMWGDAGRGTDDASGSYGVNYGTVARDGRHAYFASRNQPVVIVVDLLTMATMVSPDLTGQNNLRFDLTGSGSAGSVRGVTPSPDGKYLYVSFATLTSMYEAGENDTVAVNYLDEPVGALQVIRLDATTLDIVDKLELVQETAGVHIGRVQLSGDGKRGVVRMRHYTDASSYTPQKTHGRFFLIDTDTMSILDGNPAAGDQQAAYDFSNIGWYVGGVTLADDGQTAYAVVGTSTDFSLMAVDLATAQAAEMTPPVTVTQPTNTKDLLTGPDGRIYWVGSSRTVVYDPNEQSWVGLPFTNNKGVAFSESSCSWYQFGSREIVHHDLANDAVMDAPANGAATVTRLSGSNIYNHAFTVSPF